MIYQCLGISGAIALFFGMLTMAFTGIHQDWFIRSLLVFGVAALITFVVKSLDRVWQKLVLFFVCSNAIWLIFAFGQDWTPYYIWIPIGFAVILFLFLKKWKIDAASILITLAAASLAYIFYFWNFEGAIETSVLISAIVLNVAAFSAAKQLLLENSQDGGRFTKKTISFVYALIVFIILIVLNILSQDFHIQFDVTQNKLNTFSPQTTEILERLSKPLKITSFMKSDNEARALTKLVLAKYKAESSFVEVAHVDPDVDRTLTEKNQAKDGDILVQYGEQTYKTKTLSEEGLTQAILKVVSTNKTHLCFITGHGEMRLDGPDDDPRSLSALRTSLPKEGYTFENITRTLEEVPAACNVLLIVGPQQAVSRPESLVINTYLAKGGKAIFLLDPVFSNPNLGEKNLRLKESGLDEMLSDWGVKVGNNFIFQRTLELYQGEQIGSQVIGFQYGNHPIVDPLKGKQTLFDAVQSIQALDGFEGTTYKLIETFGDGATWTKSNIRELLVDRNVEPGANDLLGPVPFAIASEKEGESVDQKTQLIVVGDADFISNDLIISNEYNFDLFFNMLGWLSGEQAKISIRPKLFKSSALELSENQTKWIFYIAIVLLPMLILLFGINLWWIRKQRG